MVIPCIGLRGLVSFLLLRDEPPPYSVRNHRSRPPEPDNRGSGLVKAGRRLQSLPACFLLELLLLWHAEALRPVPVPGYSPQSPLYIHMYVHKGTMPAVA